MRYPPPTFDPNTNKLSVAPEQLRAVIDLHDVCANFDPDTFKVEHWWLGLRLIFGDDLMSQMIDRPNKAPIMVYMDGAADVVVSGTLQG